ncbi:acyltransferase family protein [Streptomyces sp. NPDC002574]|uniref:acyltransferase family protein n=1 Tax=Streptomyces sp. NPDC002574 TaxID=3364652 RepID=UPI0036A6F981
MFQPPQTDTLPPQSIDGTSPPARSARPPARREPSPAPRGTPDSAPDSAAGGPGSAGGRDPFFDNAKYLAIVLVAMGHTWGPLTTGSRATLALYLVVYAFHMPAFIVISGYFSRNFDARPDRVRRLVTGVLVPYVLFETAYGLFRRWAEHDPSQPISVFDPWYLTWFLIALFIWRLTSPIWRIVRQPVAVALVIAAVATTSAGIEGTLDLPRVLQFLPFFVVGLCAKPEWFHVLRGRRMRLPTALVFAAALAAAYWAAPASTPTWLYHQASTARLGLPWWTGVVTTVALFAGSLLLTACFFAWVPRRRTWFTALGAGTLYGYLLHGFVVKTALSLGWFDRPWVHTPPGRVAFTLIAGAVVTVLCTPPVQRVFRFAVQPRMAWAFRRTEPVSPGTR